MKKITFNEYQEQAQTTALYLDGIKDKFSDLPEEIIKMLGIAYVGLGLGECGEVQNKIKKIIRDSASVLDDDKRDSIFGELGDLLWYIANTCGELGINMGDVAQANLDKLFSRKERGVITGEGDNR